MSQAYSDPKRESETYALPDIEVWQDRVSIVHCRCGEYETAFDSAHADTTAYCPSCEKEAESVEDTDREAWFYWFCFPGCMPDGELNGPFATESEALADARDGMEDDDAAI